MCASSREMWRLGGDPPPAEASRRTLPAQARHVLKIADFAPARMLHPQAERAARLIGSPNCCLRKMAQPHPQLLAALRDSACPSKTALGQLQTSIPSPSTGERASSGFSWRVTGRRDPVVRRQFTCSFCNSSDHRHAFVTSNRLHFVLQAHGISITKAGATVKKNYSQKGRLL